MTLAPLFDTTPVIFWHTLAALALLPLTAGIFAAPKGTGAHRAMGRVWVAGMAVVAASGFFIHELRLLGPFSPIHLLSAFTLVALAANVRAARRGAIAAHRNGMIALVFGALILAGAFTFVPGRLMHAVATGG